MIKAVFFDVGNTLLHTAQPTAKICRRVLAARGHEFSTATVKAAMRQADIAHMAHYHALHDDWAQQHTIQALWLNYYRQVFDQLGLHDEEQQLGHELIAWYGQPAAWQPFPETRAVLERLHGQGLCVGAVSDWATTLPRILHAHDLTRFLDFVLCSGAIGFAKPSLQLYELALQRAGVQPHEAMHVGDSYYADVRGARAAGIHPVLIDRLGRAPAVDCTVIRDLRELEPLLERGGSPVG